MTIDKCTSTHTKTKCPERHKIGFASGHLAVSLRHSLTDVFLGVQSDDERRHVHYLTTDSAKHNDFLTLTTRVLVSRVTVTPVATELTRQPRHRHAV